MEQQTLGIPSTSYAAVVRMPSGEFMRICQNLITWGDSVLIAASKEGVKFSVTGQNGSGNIVIKPNASVDDVRAAAVFRSLNQSFDITVHSVFNLDTH